MATPRSVSRLGLGIVRRSFVLDSEDLGRRVTNGASYMLAGMLLRTFIIFGSMPILARLLTPADFGYVAMATVVTELAGLLGSFGLTNILIQRKTISRLQLDTVFWASVAVGSTLTILVFLSSFLTKWVFTNEQSGELLRWLCLNFLISSFNAPHYAILSRLMRFKTEFWINISSTAMRSISAILFAYFGFGSWSLVGGGLVSLFVAMLLIQIAVPYRPRFKFHFAYIRSTWRTSGSYLGGGFLYYINANLDLLLIGRQLGATTLGYYQNARSLTDEVRARIAWPLQRVLFPAFSSVQHDQNRMQQSVLRSSRLLAAVVCPIGFGLSAIAADLVPVLYGDQWLAMIPVLSMLGISTALKGSTATASSIFNSKNRVGLALSYNVIGTLLMILAITVTLPFGLLAVATAIAIHSLWSVLMLRIGFGLIGLNIRHVLQVLAFPVIASLLMWAGIFGIGKLAAEIHLSLMELGLKVIAGVVIYVVSLHLLSREYVIEFVGIAKRLFGIK